MLGSYHIYNWDCQGLISLDYSQFREKVCKLLTSWRVGDDIPECHRELTCSGLQGIVAEMMYQGLWFYSSLGSSSFLQNES